MSEYRPLNTDDYLINDQVDEGRWRPTNQLLDEDGEPREDLHGEGLHGLAGIASALDKYAMKM